MAVESTSGGHNRAFSLAEERVLADTVRASVPAMTHSHIQAAALLQRTQLDVAAHLPHVHTRSRLPVFRASDGFVSAFKRRQRLSSHRTALLPMKEHKQAARDLDQEAFDYVTEVRSAVLQYGERLVLNMDETPVQLCDAPTTAVVATGSKQAARIQTDFLQKNTLTTFPCVSAAGDRLRMAAILKGKTSRSLLKIRNGASDAVKQVRLYTSPQGWMTEQVMLAWMQDVVLSYTNAQPAALLLDQYAAHMTPAVRALAEHLQLQLIFVPAGLTATLQPLDVGINGALQQARRKVWRAKKQTIEGYFAPPAAGSGDTWQAAVEVRADRICRHQPAVRAQELCAGAPHRLNST